ncbi:MAG: LemA family protein [Bacilli bacterium]|nr:LemA family protein [Bacilli bacterium]
MKLIMIIILIIIIILGTIIVEYILNYNKLQSLNIKINESESIIDNELRNKYDLIIRSSNIINKLLKKEISYFKELEELKTKKISNFEMDRKITEGENLIEKVKNDYNSLNDNEEYLDITNSLKDSDEVLEAAKSFYNKYTTEINLIIKKFPTNLIAKIHKIKLRNYFDGKNMFDDEIKDFKL